jgi:glutamate 5-kinase
MITKCTIARKIASQGIDVFIANGTRDAIITDIVRDKDVPFTHFVASRKKETGVRKWLSHSDTFAKGAVVVNDGAREALLGEKATSLLMIGISKIDGFFKKGDIVRIIDKKGNNVGLGIAQFDSKKAEQNIGEKHSKPFIHYDYLVINDKIRGNINF